MSSRNVTMRTRIVGLCASIVAIASTACGVTTIEPIADASGRDTGLASGADSIAETASDTSACERDAALCADGEDASKRFRDLLFGCGFVEPPAGRCLTVLIGFQESCVTQFYVNELTVPVADCVIRQTTNSYWPCARSSYVSVDYLNCE